MQNIEVRRKGDEIEECHQGLHPWGSVCVLQQGNGITQRNPKLRPTGMDFRRLTMLSKTLPSVGQGTSARRLLGPKPGADRSTFRQSTFYGAKRQAGVLWSRPPSAGGTKSHLGSKWVSLAERHQSGRGPLEIRLYISEFCWWYLAVS